VSETVKARLTIVLKAAALGLAALVALQAYRLATEADPLGDLDLAALAAAARAGDRGPVQPPPPPPTPPDIPERHRSVATSGVLGAVPKAPPPPALLGLAGKYAILRAPGGETDLVAEGGQIGGVKLIRIGINRVLIEHQGKVEELAIFSGLGGAPLAAPGKEGAK
jgi:hypothetical protein